MKQDLLHKRHLLCKSNVFCSILHRTYFLNFRRFVITAAHCQHKSNPRKQIAEVVLGEYDLSKDPDCDGPCRKAQRFEITPADVLVHEDWNLAKV